MSSHKEGEIIIDKEVLNSLPLLYQALAIVWQRKGKVRISETREVLQER